MRKTKLEIKLESSVVCNSTSDFPHGTQSSSFDALGFGSKKFYTRTKNGVIKLQTLALWSSRSDVYLFINYFLWGQIQIKLIYPKIV